VSFKAYPANPVFAGAGEGHWDAKIRERGWVLREGDRWHLWYTGYEGEGIRRLGYATSPDGLNWTRWPGNPLVPDVWVEDMMVVKAGTTYHMFAEGEGDQTHRWTSEDRVHWHDEGVLDIRQSNGEAIPPGPFGTPVALHEEGVWWLLYEREDAAVWLAKSPDLKVWTHVQEEPVLRPGPDAYDAGMIALNQVVKHAGKYYGYFHGLVKDSKPEVWTSNVAVSEDLVHWEKYAGNPLRANDQSSPQMVWDGIGWRLYVMHPEVRVYLGEGKKKSEPPRHGGHGGKRAEE
jgi:sucrose-6-phosphate hydrolase SacC (GH32 family)